jgi:hypothetical protein
VAESFAGQQFQIMLLKVVDFGVASLGFEQHRERAVFVRGNGLDWVHDNTDFECAFCHYRDSVLCMQSAANYTSESEGKRPKFLDFWCLRRAS